MFIPGIAYLIQGGAAVASYFGIKTAATAAAVTVTPIIKAATVKAAQLGTLYLGGEVLSAACSRAGDNYIAACNSTFESMRCSILQGSVITSCGAEFATYILSGKAVYDGYCQFSEYAKG
jgi:hypothetical protein